MGNIGSHMDLTSGWWRHQGRRTTSIRFRWISRNLPTSSIRKRLEGIALRMRVLAPADGGVFCAAEDRFGLAQQLPAVLMQGAILPGQLLGRILHHLPTAFVKIL